MRNSNFNSVQFVVLNKVMRSKLLLLSFAAICSFFAAAANAQSYAITNARIVTVSGATIEKGTIVIRNGLINAVGANLMPPADAQVFDATGLTVYPGFIDALTNLGLGAAAAAPAGGGGRGGGGGGQAAAAARRQLNRRRIRIIRPGCGPRMRSSTIFGPERRSSKLLETPGLQPF